MNPAYRILHLQRVTSATESPDYTKKGAGQHTIPVVRRLKCSVKSGAPSSHKKQRARYTSLFIHDMYFLFPYVGIIQIRFQVKTNQVYSQPLYLSSPFVRHYTKLRNNFQAFFNISPFSAVSVPDWSNPVSPIPQQTASTICAEVRAVTQFRKDSSRKAASVTKKDPAYV